MRPSLSCRCRDLLVDIGMWRYFRSSIHLLPDFSDKRRHIIVTSPAQPFFGICLGTTFCRTAPMNCYAKLLFSTFLNWSVIHLSSSTPLFHVQHQLPFSSRCPFSDTPVISNTIWVKPALQVLLQRICSVSSISLLLNSSTYNQCTFRRQKTYYSLK